MPKIWLQRLGRSAGTLLGLDVALGGKRLLTPAIYPKFSVNPVLY